MHPFFGYRQVDRDTGCNGGVILILDNRGWYGYKELSKNYAYWAIEDIGEQKPQTVIRDKDRDIY